MIQAADFITPALARGYSFYAGVPCSFLTPFINHVIGDPQLSYVSAANEGDAVATAVGVALGGGKSVAMMQNSGLGNAVSPLTSLAYVFRVPLLVICTHRGAPDVSDEPQHELMGQISGEMFDLMRIPWQNFPANPDEVNKVLDEIASVTATTSRPYALLMQKNTVESTSLGPQPMPTFLDPEVTRMEPFVKAQDDRLSRYEALTMIATAFDEASSVLVATTGYTGRELYAISDRPHQLYMVGSMGCASSLGLGLALSQPTRKIVVIEGDGAALMRMGNLATLGAYRAENLVHIILDNEVHDSTGAQATVSKSVNFARVAQACGYRSVAAGDDTELLQDFLKGSEAGPRLLHFKIRRGTINNLPRPSITPATVARRLQSHLGVSTLGD